MKKNINKKYLKNLLTYINIIKNKSKPILTRAGIDIANANNKVRMPLAPLTNLKTRPTLTTLTTLRTVGENDRISFT